MCVHIVCVNKEIVHEMMKVLVLDNFNYYLSNLRCGRVGVTRMGSTPKLPIRGDPYPTAGYLPRHDVLTSVDSLYINLSSSR